MSPDRQTAPFGSWRSPITADLILAGTVQLSEIRLDGADTYWLEGRPREAGRIVLVRRDAAGQTADLTPPPFNVRDRVHEYGGGAYAVHEGTVYFSNFVDNRLYRVCPGGEPQALTPEAPFYYADLTVDPGRNRLLCIREDHSHSHREAINTIATVDRTSGESEMLVSGADFYAAPRLSPDGRRLAWLSWNHPNMPWDETELWVADLDGSGRPQNARKAAGGPREAVQQPRWSPDGTLFFVSDRTGWWNIYRLTADGDEPVAVIEGEIGGPMWVFGISTYAFLGADSILCVVQQNGLGSLFTVSVVDSIMQRIESPYIGFGSIRAAAGRAVFLAGASDRPTEIVEMDAASGRCTRLATAGELTVDPAYLSRPEPIEFPTSGGRTAHALYYPPTNRDFSPPEGTKPPLIVASHGGPTGATSSLLNLNGIQYWTSRGFAVVDVNYGGSTGYGREYRERLNGQWGVVDVEDCAAAARFLAEQGNVDGDKLAIHGGSAGGYTTLAALAFTDVFDAGASYFGIGDLTVFAQDTHKFESRYMDSLVGPLPAAAATYRERSPINSIDRISCPVVLFQGADDKIVPPNQATLTAEALDRKGLPYALVVYPGEGHGFRQAANIKHTLEGELYFYSRIFGFDLSEAVEEVEIHNLPG